MNVLKIAVTDFAKPNRQTGDIDERGQMSQVATEIGIVIHRRIQKKRARENVGYECEVAVSSVLSGEDLCVEVSGRLDGLWGDDGAVVVEEIKSSLNVRRTLALLRSEPEHPYILQARTYAWMVWKERNIIPRVHILFVAAGSGEETIFPVEFDPADFTLWIEERTRWISTTWRDVERFKDERKILAKAMKFPFTKKREGQKSLLRDVESTCSKDGQLLAQAPTGLGKTAAVMFPMLRHALGRGDKLFHVTPKNSQLREAEKFIVRLQKKSPGIRGMILTAKPKICMNEDVRCVPDICQFAKGHYDKVNEHDLIAQLRGEAIINQKVLQEYAARYEVCPYELGRQVMPWMDVIAGDYHYALSPHASINELGALPLVKNPSPVLSIDEGHNLAERAIEWYTAGVSKIQDEICADAGHSLKKSVRKVNDWFQTHIDGTPQGKTILRALDRVRLGDLMEAWSSAMVGIFEGLSEAPESNPLIAAWFSWIRFAELAVLPESLFFGHIAEDRGTLTLRCVNAGPILRATLAKYSAVVAFSATLKPFKYHADMCGFDSESVISREYASPFPASNRCIIAIPQVSTAYKDRPRHTPRIADVVERVIAEKMGNYVAFFPSFELMRQTIPLVKARGFEVIEQPSRAPQFWIKSTLRALRKKRNILLFAVQGGVLSEGIDLPGDELIGAFVVGPALPMVTPEREERRRMIDDLGGDGFATTYIYPAMARSVQSAGRVVRTPSDRGLIVLMDPRFLTPPYAESMPEDWTAGKNSPRDLISKSILGDVRRFWGLPDSRV